MRRLSLDTVHCSNLKRCVCVLQREQTNEVVGFVWTMGIYASHFQKNDGQILTAITDPSQANWIAIHADTCKMPVPEVQRCWSRFLMFQPDQKGNVPRMRLLQTNSPFGQKLLKQIPVTDGDQLTFQTYCNALAWLSKSSLETKVKGLYQTLFSGIVGKEQLRHLLHDLYPMQSCSAIDELSATFLKEVDKDNQGYISEDMFVAWVLSFSEEIVKSTLDFPIIPPNLTQIEHPTSYLSFTVDIQDKEGLSDLQLVKVATEIATRKRNWRLLASKLGVTEKHNFHLGNEHGKTKDQILKMLLSWHRACQGAPLPILQAALRESGNVDICNEVFHLSF
ncbi:uncharacterized protein LOC128405218 [Podarcis raffonei]|uniref:uncharacterized protein LOC128405218 n=1 Tax=Podarcis raffonei TaxID=65483 RepID=UPI0023292551|nr:uncharacterized protein LOC128405218 [Podarcis raffonei]